MAQYRLPPPWSPNYALPDNVRDEGLERHAYVTSWAPRGTYDETQVGDGGYAVPRYVRAEGYGRGVYSTKWAPRGTYYGPRVPNWLNRQGARIVATKALPRGAAAVAIQTMGATEAAVTGQTALIDHGKFLARNLIETVQGLPDKDRVATLRKILDKIDPTLYGRTEKLATEEAKTGTPPLVALERALAYQMTQGFAREVHKLGAKGSVPARKTMLGGILSLAADDAPTTPQPGQCDATGRMIWDSAGFWRARKASEQCVGEPFNASGTSRTGGGGGVSGEAKTGRDTKTTRAKQIRVGTFLMPVDAPSGTVITWHRELPAEWQSNMIKTLSTDCSPCIRTSMRPSASGNRLGALRDFIPGLPDQINHDFVGGNWDKSQSKTTDAAAPIVRFTHPTLGGDWGAFLRLSAPRDGESFNSSNVPYLQVVFKQIPDPGFWGALWNAIKEVVATVVEAVEDAAKWVADQTCKLMTGPAGGVVGAAAGAVGGAYAGIPPDKGAQAGVAAQQLIAGACEAGKGGAPKDSGPPSEGPSSMMPLVLIGGAALAAVLLIKKKKGGAGAAAGG